ncbi:hypothetical protein SAMN02910456_00846 [Ruminococcaceae bacterium YRB3002]|nr:hypothetical protein SAMN02910456_00846 [Ruminococcaceae bacterium YRB3002]
MFDKDYSYDEDGIVSIDLDKRQADHLCIWNYVDIVPPYERPDKQVYSFGKDLFVITYTYETGESELFIYRSTGEANKNISKTPITVGGYSLTDDYILMREVYDFNTCNDEYRIVMDEYGKEYSYSNAEEAQEQKLRLLSHFTNDGYPDILYGNWYYYYQMGQNGQLLDISDCISDRERKTMYSSINDLMNSDGKTYYVFSGFEILGYWGLDSKVSYVENIYDLNDMKNDGGRLFDNEFTVNVADSAIRYALQYRINKGNDREFTSWEVADIVSFAIENGMSYDEYFSSSPGDLWDFQYGGYFLVNSSTVADIPVSVEKAIDSVNTVDMIDWGVFNNILEEIESYYNDNKPVDVIANELCNRINLYIRENY